MNSGLAPEDRLLNAWDRLAGLVGPGRQVWPSETEKFSQFLKDATFLTGHAALVLQPENVHELRAIVVEAQALREALPQYRRALSLTLRGGGSGLSGACVPDGGIVLDLTRINRVAHIDEQNQSITAECGVILSELNTALSGTGLRYPVDPSSSTLCTVGGSIATNAAGPSSLKYGTTRANLAAVTVMTPTGKLLRAGSLPVKTSMGFSLPDLFCGSEGRLGIITEAQLRLQVEPEESALLVAAIESESEAMEFILKLRRSSIRPVAIEMLDYRSASLVDFPPGCPAGGALLLVGLDGTAEEVQRDLERLQQLAEEHEFIAARDEKNRRALWNRRKAVSIEVSKLAPHRIGEDVAVPVAALPRAMEFARKRAAAQQIETAIWGHAGDGNLHINYLLENTERLEIVLQLMAELASEVTRLGGAMSGEHGLGRLKRAIARQVMPEEYFALQSSIKKALDAQYLFNPALDEESE
ncbi:MAG: FAD-linked oxidase C-terminal domain-containing protein [Turneriella sp.]